MKDVFPQTRVLFFASIVFFLASIGLYVFGIISTTQAQEEIHTLKKTIADSLSKNTAQKKLETDFYSTESDRGRLSEYVLSKDGGVAQFEQLDELAQLAKVTFQSSSVVTEAIPNNKEVQMVKIVGNASGSYSATHHFLRLLETLPKSSIVEEVEFSQVQGGDAKKVTEWRLSFILKTLARK